MILDPFVIFNPLSELSGIVGHEAVDAPIIFDLPKLAHLIRHPKYDQVASSAQLSIHPNAKKLEQFQDDHNVGHIEPAFSCILFLPNLAFDLLVSHNSHRKNVVFQLT